MHETGKDAKENIAIKVDKKIYIFFIQTFSKYSANPLIISLGRLDDSRIKALLQERVLTLFRGTVCTFLVCKLPLAGNSYLNQSVN